MINANNATKIKQNFDVTNEAIRMQLLFWILFIHFLNVIWLLVSLKEEYYCYWNLFIFIFCMLTFHINMDLYCVIVIQLIIFHYFILFCI